MSRALWRRRRAGGDGRALTRRRRAAYARRSKATRYAAAGDLPPQSWTKTYAAAPRPERRRHLFAAAVAGTGAQVEEAWKQANMLDYARPATIMVRVPTGELDHFVDSARPAGADPGHPAQRPPVARPPAVPCWRYITSARRTSFAPRWRSAISSLDGQDPDWVLDRRGAALRRREPPEVSSPTSSRWRGCCRCRSRSGWCSTATSTAAFWLFVAAGLSDAVDGYIAKHFDQRSRLGALLDPLADKVLLVSMFVTLGISRVAAELARHPGGVPRRARSSAASSSPRR